MHRNCRHDPGRRTEALKRILQRERINDGREHSHVIGRDPVHTGLGETGAAKNVSATDDHADFDTHRTKLRYLASDALNYLRVDSVGLIAEQGFPAQFKHHTSIGRRICCHVFLSLEPFAAASLL
jgi:hypothetical protein